MDENRTRFFPMYYSYIDQLQLLTFEQVGKLTMALLQSGIDGEPPEFDDAVVQMAYSFITENSRRSEFRLEKKRAAGRARAASGKRDADGKLVSDPEKSTENSQHKPAQASTSQHDPAIQNTKDKIQKTKDKEQSTKYKRQKTKDISISSSDDIDTTDDERKILDFYSQAIGSMTDGQKKDLLKAASGLDCKKVIDAISIAHECKARSPAYVIRCIETIREHPDREPKCIDLAKAKAAPDGILARCAKSVPRIAEDAATE